MNSPFIVVAVSAAGTIFYWSQAGFALSLEKAIKYSDPAVAQRDAAYIQRTKKNIAAVNVIPLDEVPS
jgi:hypothetical protein